MPRKTDSNNPSDWLFFAEAELEAIDELSSACIGYYMCCSKLAEALEKILKAELIRLGWFLEKTHDLQKLVDQLVERDSDLAVSLLSLVESLSEQYFIARYPGFDLEDPDWPLLRNQLAAVKSLFDEVRKRV